MDRTRPPNSRKTGETGMDRDYLYAPECVGGQTCIRFLETENPD